MAYTKNTWTDGDIVTSEKLNHMEEGIASSGMMVINDTDGTLDKTWQEISDAMAANIFCAIKAVGQGIGSSSVNNYLVVQTRHDEMSGTYSVATLFDTGTRDYSTTSATGYPILVQ